jgi:hypothetical protein
MALSFYPELVEAIPENYQGVEVCEVIDLWLKDHPEAAQECRTILKNWLISTGRRMLLTLILAVRVVQSVSGLEYMVPRR